MKNTYFIGYFPFIAIVLFSLSFAMYCEVQLIELFFRLGLYQGMLEFFSETEIKMALLVVMLLLFFMVLSALKLLSDTSVELSLLFFSKESDGTGLISIRTGAIIYVVGAVLSLFSTHFLTGLLAIFIVTNISAFIYFVYKLTPTLNMGGLIGLIFFHIFIWSMFLSIISYSGLKLYNSVIDSLPV